MRGRLLRCVYIYEAIWGGGRGGAQHTHTRASYEQPARARRAAPIGTPARRGAARRRRRPAVCVCVCCQWWLGLGEGRANAHKQEGACFVGGKERGIQKEGETKLAGGGQRLALRGGWGGGNGGVVLPNRVCCMCARV